MRANDMVTGADVLATLSASADFVCVRLPTVGKVIRFSPSDLDDMREMMQLVRDNNALADDEADKPVVVRIAE
jgi:hypothetical protein